MLALIEGRPLHVVAATAPTGTIFVVTVYQPDPARWDETFRIRRSGGS
jgi:hypothetical protein